MALCPRSTGRRPELTARFCRTDGDQAAGVRLPRLPAVPPPGPASGQVCSAGTAGGPGLPHWVPSAAPLGAPSQWSPVLLVWGWRLLQAPWTAGPGDFNSLRLVAACVGPGIPLAGSHQQQATFGPCPRLSLLVQGVWAWSVPRALGQQPAAGRRSAPGPVAVGALRQRRVAARLAPPGAAPHFSLALPLSWCSL